MEPLIKNGKLGYTEAQQRELRGELESERVVLVCGQHNYQADLLKAPSESCEECWNAYLVTFLGTMPPHLRDEVCQALQEFAHRTVENPLGYIQFDHPQIEIVKG